MVVNGREQLQYISFKVLFTPKKYPKIQGNLKKTMNPTELYNVKRGHAKSTCKNYIMSKRHIYVSLLEL